MADRSFEEQVRKELETLRFTPDAQVWKNVDAALRKEKKHRWLVWFIIPAVLAGSAGLLYQFDRTAENTGIAVPPHRTDKQAGTAMIMPGNNAVGHTDKNGSTGKIEIPHIQPPVVSGSTAGRFSAPGKATYEKNRYPEAQPAAIVAATVTAAPPVVVPAQDQPTGVDKSTMATNATPPGKSVYNTEKENKSREPAKTVATGSIPVVVLQDSSSKYTVQVTGEKADAVVEQPSSTPKADSTQFGQQEAINTAASIVKHDKNKWRLFGSMEIGRSGEIVSLASAPQAMVADFASIGGGSAPPSGSSASNPGSNNPTYKTPSRSGGSSFGLHVQALKNVGKKGSLGLSLGYAYYSSIVGVGSQVTALANGFANNNTSYLSTDSIGYRNSYHFLSLNGDYYLNFRLGAAASLRWRIGAGLGFLLASNVLHYSQSQRILYEDRSALSTIHTNLSTGLDVGIGKQQLFFIGPQFSYSLSGSSINGSSGSSRHLFNASLRATMAIPKKKK